MASSERSDEIERRERASSSPLCAHTCMFTREGKGNMRRGENSPPPPLMCARAHAHERRKRGRKRESET